MAPANLDSGLASHSTRDRPQLATVAWLRLAHARGKRWMNFTLQLSPTVDLLTVLPVFACTTGRISTRPTCAMWMGISWPRFAVALRKDNEVLEIYISDSCRSAVRRHFADGECESFQST